LERPDIFPNPVIVKAIVSFQAGCIAFNRILRVTQQVCPKSSLTFAPLPLFRAVCIDTGIWQLLLSGKCLIMKGKTKLIQEYFLLSISWFITQWPVSRMIRTTISNSSSYWSVEPWPESYFMCQIYCCKHSRFIDANHEIQVIFAD